jgi:hypothetical protein
MDFQNILKEKYLNNIINNHVNFLNHKDKTIKMLHQIKFSKTLKLIDPFYKLKNKNFLHNYSNNSILYRCLLKDQITYLSYNQLKLMNLYELKKYIDQKIFRVINLSLWNSNSSNFMLLNFINNTSVSRSITRRCYFNIQYIELCIEANRRDLIEKNY